jgi:hypothetical protein
MRSREFALTIVALLVSLLLLEGGVRVYYSLDDHVPPNADSATRNEWRWAQQHLAAGSARLPGAALYDSELGWVPAADLDTWARRGAFGLAPGDLKVRTAGRRRIVFVGDSYTFGLYVEPQQAFPYRTGQLLADVQTINLGVSGYGPDQMLLAYESRGHALAADVVVMGFYVRGFYRALSRFTYFAKPYFAADAAGEYHLAGVPVITPEQLFEAYRSGQRRIAGGAYSYLAASVAASWARFAAGQRITDPVASGWPVMTAILDRFRAAVVAAGAVPVLLVIPNRLEQYDASVETDLDRLACAEAQRLAMMCISLAAPLATAMAAVPELPVFRDRSVGGHLSVRGHEVAAQTLARALAVTLAGNQSDTGTDRGVANIR